MANKLELTFVGKNDEVNIEPRLLIENKNLSNVVNDENTENMIIHGDNLIALKALEAKYAGKIKCIYIDPPYNTGSAFEHYDDNLEHSIWLKLMKMRLEILRNLLKDNGVICVQIDKNESAYLKVLMDEIFGRNAYVTTIAIRMSATSGYKIEHADKTIVKNTEYIHIYSSNLQLKPIYETTEYDSHYSLILKDTGSVGKYCIGKLVDEKIVKEELEKYHLSTSSKNLTLLYKVSDRFVKYIYDNRQIVGRTHTAPASATEKQKELFDVLENQNQVIEFIAESGEKYYIKKTSNSLNQFIPIGLKFNLVDSYKGYSVELSNILGDWWDGFYYDMGNVENEGGVEFKASKKPERLLFRILNMFTSEGDLVLDSFLGSGTTCAVAHKMKRKYIGIEMGQHAYTHCKVRLDKVVTGTDKGGITEMVGWTGGGAYRFFELAPTLIKKDEFGIDVINEEYDADMLAAAVALHEGYIYKPDKDFFWKQARSNEHSYLYVTTSFIDEKYVESIYKTMSKEEYLIIVCKNYKCECESLHKNIKLKKIPESLLKKCEFDKDNYNLNIISPPFYEEE